MISGSLLDYLWATYKIRNTETRNGMHGIQGRRAMFTRVLGNFLKDFGKYCHFNTSRNVQKDSSECSQRLWGMFGNVPGNIQNESRECSKRFREMFKKIPGEGEAGRGVLMFKKTPGNAQKRFQGYYI